MRHVIACLAFSLGGCGSEGLAADDTPLPTPLASASTATTRVALPPAGMLYHGVYPGGFTGNENDITSANVDAYEAAAGRKVAWVSFSHNWFQGRAFPVATATWIRGRGAVPYIRLMLRSNMNGSTADPVYTLAAINAGKFDASFNAWADAARSFATPIIVDYGVEVNGQWFPWNGRWNGGATTGPKAFRAAYRRIVTLMRARGATNLTWVFHVADYDDPQVSWNAFENYYPGDDIVDWIGLSDYGAQAPTDTDWPIFADGMNSAVPRLTKMAPGKPVFVLEFGATSGSSLGDPARWSDDALAGILGQRWPSVRGFSWWNETWQNDSNPAHDSDMRVQSVPGLSAVFQKWLVSNPKVMDRPVIGP